MKKSILTFAALLLSLSIISCSDSSASEKKDDKKGNNIEKGALSAGIDGEDKNKGLKSIHLNKEQFLEKVFNYENNPDEWKFEGEIPCIVDFYADWCQPCKIAGPILDELAAEYEGKIHVYKIDTEKEKELAAAFGIRSIPTFMLCPKEGQPQVFSGIGQTKEATKEMFKKAIDEVLLGKKAE